MKYLFQVGRTPDLSVRELISCGLDGELIREQLFQVEHDEKEQDKVIAQFNELGGSLKLLKVVGEFTDLNEEDLVNYVAAYFAQFPKPTFAIGELYRDNIEKIQSTDVKNALKERGVSSRFIDAPREGLSASVLLHQKVSEIIVVRVDEHTTLFGQTLGVQNIDQWTIRDREKPYADRKKGMLPPKVARMMVNIGLGELKKVSDSAPIIYDPFCGTGTVLIEGMVMGYPVIGTDLDATAAGGTTNNLRWLQERYGLSAKFTVFQSDVSHVQEGQLDVKPNLIVTEPFLGKPKPDHDQLPNMFRGMEKLYLGAFRQWRALLADNAVITMIFPFATDGKHDFSLESIIDKIATLGYTPTSEPCLYHRPQAVIQRQVWTFQFKQSVGAAKTR